MIRRFCLLALYCLSVPLLAQTDDDYRGGWTAEIDGQLHILLLKLRDGNITGVHCVADCRNPANLALVESGRVDGADYEFLIWQQPPGESAYYERMSGRLINGQLLGTRVRIDDSGSPALAYILSKTPAPPPMNFGRGGGDNAAGPPPRPRPAYNAPGPAEELSPAKVAGLWIAGSGPDKQNFIFRQNDEGLYGMVCGPCDDTNAMAPLDEIRIEGAELHFNIVHEDWGIGIEQGVFNMISVGTIAANELHFTAVRDTDETGREAVMTLLGPIEYQSVE